MYTINVFIKSTKEWLRVTYGVTTRAKAKAMAAHQFGGRENVLFEDSVVAFA